MRPAAICCMSACAVRTYSPLIFLLPWETTVRPSGGANFGPLAYDTDHDEVWNWVSPAVAGPTACRPEELKAMSSFSTWASCGFLRFRRGASEPFRDCKAHFSCDSCAWSLDGSVGCFRQVPESCAFCMDWTAASSQVSHYAQLLAACRCLATRVSR